MKIRPIALILALMLLSSCTAPTAVTETDAPTAPAITQAPAAPIVPEPEQPKASVEYIVQTDYSGLTPYVQRPDICTRLSDGPMPELVPSKSYGSLVPYVGARLYSNNGFTLQKHGMVTLGGMMVTDAVYTRVSLEYSPSGENSAFSLAKADPNGSKNAACAADGSWCTPFIYADIIFLNNVILAPRPFFYGTGEPDEKPFDIDVYDYSGRLLYNFLDLPADIFDIVERSALIYWSAAGDYTVTTLENDRIAYIHLPTGKVTRTEYNEARRFSDGMSAVRLGTLWGYVDNNLECVIAPQYYLVEDFINGRAIVASTTPVSSSVINKEGSVLFNVTGSASLNADFDGGYYALVDAQYHTIALYTPDFVEIPAEIDGNTVYYAGDGYFWCEQPGGALLVSPDGTRRELPGVRYILNIGDGLILYSTEETVTRVKTLSGEDLISSEYRFVNRIANTGLLYTGSVDGVTVYDLDGNVFARCRGLPGFTAAHGLLGVNTVTEFYYLDQNGDTVFRISLKATATD